MTRCVRTWFILPLTACVGCQVCRVCPANPAPAFSSIECNVASVAGTRSTPEIQVCAAAAPTPTPVDLPSFWNLALANNPSLREAAGDVEAARGLLIQAGLYPNPRFVYDQNTIGSRIAPQGNFVLQLNQEIVTGGKRTLDINVANRAVDVQKLALIGRKFTTLTRVRRAYYDYVGLEAIVHVNEEIVATLQRGVDVTRRQVEEAKTRPRTDVLRLEALLENARITLTTNRSNRDAAWRHLAAEVGLPDLPMPAAKPPTLPETAPTLDVKLVNQRVLTAHSDLKQALMDTERARLALERAKAQAVPNVTVGAGYSAENIDSTAGGHISLDVPLPLWDRNQGHIYEAKARFAQTVAFQSTTVNRLTQETAAAFARYTALRQQVDRLTDEVLPRLRESLDLLLKGYQAGAAQVTFADVFQAEQDLNATRLALADARRNLWLAFADLQGLMQIDIDEDVVAVAVAPAPDRAEPPDTLPSPRHVGGEVPRP